MGLEKCFQPGAQRIVSPTDSIKESFALRAIGLLEGFAEEDFFPFVSRFHRRAELFRAPESWAVTGASQRLVAQIKCLYRSGPPYEQV